jgi:hypothetical protein
MNLKIHTKEWVLIKNLTKINNNNKKDIMRCWV